MASGKFAFFLRDRRRTIAGQGETRTDVTQDIFRLMAEAQNGDALANGALNVYIARAMRVGARWVSNPANRAALGGHADMQADLNWMGNQGIRYSGSKFEALGSYIRDYDI